MVSIVINLSLCCQENVDLSHHFFQLINPFRWWNATV